MTALELKKFDGKDGRKAYVSYKGNVYDVTESRLWKNGEHEEMHIAGSDLTEAMGNAPHSEEVFKDFKIVDVLKDNKSISVMPKSDKSKKERLKEWYFRFHPHPLTVHFPIALHFFAAGMDIAFLLSYKEAYEIGVFYAFFVATVMGAVAMAPGILSWWINYNFSQAKAFVIKLYVSILTLFLGLIGITLRIENPNVAYQGGFAGVLYHSIIFFTVLAVIVLAYYGGRITWSKKERLVTSEPSQTTQPISVQEPTYSHYSPKKEEYTLVNPASIEDEPIYLGSYSNSTLFLDSPQKKELHSLSILICGAAGSGIQTLESLLVEIFKVSGFAPFTFKEFMSRIRGGSNSILLRIGDEPIYAPCWSVDMALLLDDEAYSHIKERLHKNSIVIGDSELSGEIKGLVDIPIKKMTKEMGRYINTYVSGIIASMLNIEENLLTDAVKTVFAKKDPDSNVNAAKQGYEAGKALRKSSIVLPEPPKTPLNSLFMDGTTACSFGFLAGGCNFVCSYPMSPSTGVLTFMAEQSEEFVVLVEQAEDEIAAFNMGLGAWFAGARGMTTTSGGGFALMCEAMSLSGMSETPMVVYLAMRPGPATGLPTRTEQGDLNLALYAGHGAFARILLAPGSLKECVDFSYLAFELADRYQAPVVVLVDQYLADTIQGLETIDFSAYPQRRYIKKSEADYNRFMLTENGISPRAIPAFGEGVVVCVSDEHDERGQITESYKMRDAMVEKRQNKLSKIIEESIAPVAYGSSDIAIIGWGSTQNIIKEALLGIDDERVFQVHFPWIYPLKKENLSFLNKTKLNIVIENNSDAQFAALLKLYDIQVHKTVLQSDGFPFFADTLTKRVASLLMEIA